jgi:hypothetical protein
MGFSFFRVLADPAKSNRWFLDEPRTEDGQGIDAREFTEGVPYKGLVAVLVPIGQPGEVVGFTFAAFDMPVISDRIMHIIKAHAADSIQFFPIRIGRLGGGFGILNVVARVKCIDESLSNVVKWMPQDGRPEKIGQYRTITHLTIDPSRCGPQHIFRIEGWEIALIVSRALKEASESVADTGLVFSPVTRERVA